MAVTINDIIQDVIKALGEVDGAGVQVYSEDRIRDNVKRAFRMLVTKYPWDEYTRWFTVTLDGTTGLATANDLQVIIDLVDIISVRRNGEDTEMPKLMPSVNPSTLGNGARGLFWRGLWSTHASFLTKRIIIYPVTATGSIDVNAKIYPDPITDDTEVFVDRLLITFFASWMALEIEGTNPGAADAQKLLFETRYKDLIDNLGSQVQRTGGYPPIPDQWSERP